MPKGSSLLVVNLAYWGVFILLLTNRINISNDTAFIFAFIYLCTVLILTKEDK